jgi:hypothetical protein
MKSRRGTHVSYTGDGSGFVPGYFFRRATNLDVNFGGREPLSSAEAILSADIYRATETKLKKKIARNGLTLGELRLGHCR